MKLTENALRELAKPGYVRVRQAEALAAADALGLPPTSSVREFYLRYQGPFGSKAIPFQFHDLIEDEWSVLRSTMTCRAEARLPERFVVLSDLYIGSALMVDRETDKVFNVDFEGGVELVGAGELEPRWPSFEVFLAEFFG